MGWRINCKRHLTMSLGDQPIPVCLGPSWFWSHVLNTPSFPGKSRCLVTHPAGQPQCFISLSSNPRILSIRCLYMWAQYCLHELWTWYNRKQKLWHYFGLEGRVLDWELVGLPINNCVALGKKNLSSLNPFSPPEWSTSDGCFIRFLPTPPHYGFFLWI